MAETKLSSCLMCQSPRVDYTFPGKNEVKIYCMDCGLKYVQKHLKHFTRDSLLEKMVKKWNAAHRPQIKEAKLTSAELEKNKSLSVVVAQMEYAIGVLKRGLGFSNSLPSGATNNERSAIGPCLTCVGTGKVHSFGNTERCPVCGGWGKLASISGTLSKRKVVYAAKKCRKTGYRKWL